MIVVGTTSSLTETARSRLSEKFQMVRPLIIQPKTKENFRSMMKTISDSCQEVLVPKNQYDPSGEKVKVSSCDDIFIIVNEDVVNSLSILLTTMGFENFVCS